MNEKKLKQTWLILQFIRLANELNEPTEPIIKQLIDIQSTIEKSIKIDDYYKFKTIEQILLEVYLND